MIYWTTAGYIQSFHPPFGPDIFSAARRKLSEGYVIIRPAVPRPRISEGESSSRAVDGAEGSAVGETVALRSRCCIRFAF